MVHGVDTGDVDQCAYMHAGVLALFYVHQG